MDAGRRWVLELLGEYGPEIRARVPKMVQDEHNASLDAQEASAHRSNSVYGEFWRGILEKFESFAKLPDAILIRPGEAPYKIPVVNGVPIFPWRFSSKRGIGFERVLFQTSEARGALSGLQRFETQGILDIDLPKANISEADREFLRTFREVLQDPAVTKDRFVLVAISSSVHGLFSAEWGEAELTPDGYARWVGHHEHLLTLPKSKPVLTRSTGTFTAGEVPKNFPQIAYEESAGGSTDE